MNDTVKPAQPLVATEPMLPKPPELVPAWWLSFADHGVCIVEGATFEAALQRTHELKIHPGSQVRGLQFTLDMWQKLPESYRNVLLTKEQSNEAVRLMR